MIPISNKNTHELALVHTQAIIDYYSKRSRAPALRAVNNWISRFLGVKLELQDILTAPPSKLKKIAQIFDRKNPRPRIPNSINLLKILYGNFATVSKSPFRLSTGSRYNAYTLVDSLGISVCPYCNRNYVFNIPTTKRRTSQLDHFYNKDSYPFFSLSFYNLIPVCQTCNHIKSNVDGAYYNPYDNSKTSDELINFSVKLKGPGYLDNLSDIEIELTPCRLLQDNVNNLKLKEIYSKHSDLVQEIIKKKKIYNAAYIDSLLKSYEGKVFKNREELIGLILSNYIAEDELHKRPFAKMTKDIWEQLNV